MSRVSFCVEDSLSSKVGCTRLSLTPRGPPNGACANSLWGGAMTHTSLPTCACTPNTLVAVMKQDRGGSARRTTPNHVIVHVLQDGDSEFANSRKGSKQINQETRVMFIWCWKKGVMWGRVLWRYTYTLRMQNTIYYSALRARASFHEGQGARERGMGSERTGRHAILRRRRPNPSLATHLLSPLFTSQRSPVHGERSRRDDE